MRGAQNARYITNVDGWRKTNSEERFFVSLPVTSSGAGRMTTKGKDESRTKIKCRSLVGQKHGSRKKTRGAEVAPPSG